MVFFRGGLLLFLLFLLLLLLAVGEGGSSSVEVTDTPSNVCADGTRCVGAGVCCCQRVGGVDYCNPYCLPDDYLCCGCVLTYAANSTVDVVGYFCGGCPSRSVCRAALPECFSGNRSVCADPIPGLPFICSPASSHWSVLAELLFEYA